MTGTGIVLYMIYDFRLTIVSNKTAGKS